MVFKKKSYLLTRRKLSILGYYNEITVEDNSPSKKSVTHPIEPNSFNPFLGLFYICLHATFNQLASVIIKMLPYINPCQLSLIRHVGIFVAILPITIYQTDKIFGKREHRLLLFLRGVFGATGFYFQIMAYSYLPLAEASIILSTLPVVTAVMARILLKEPYGLVESLSSVMSVFGVLLAIRIPELFRNRNSVHFNSTYIVGLAASVGNVLLSSISFIYTRKIKEVQFSVFMLYLGIVGGVENAVLNGIFIPFVPPKCGWDQILCLLLAGFYFVSNCLFVTALRKEPAGLVTVQKSSFDVLLIIAFQIIFFNVYPDIYVICGACFVTVSLAILGIRNWIVIIKKTTHK